jgi:hypothetical protein
MDVTKKDILFLELASLRCWNDNLIGAEIDQKL